MRISDWSSDVCSSDLGWNAQAKHLFGAWLARASPNLLRFVFLDGSARRFIVGWEDRARRLVAECRAELARQHDDPETLALIAELRSGSPDFAIWGDEQNVLDPRTEERRGGQGGVGTGRSQGVPD